MSSTAEGPWREIVERARGYPSPHNSQPIKTRITGPSTADIFYDLDLGLPAENYGIPFGHVCAGVFLESLTAVAGGLGYGVSEQLVDDDLDFSSPDRLHRLGSVTLSPNAVGDTAADDAAAARARAFAERRTSRRPYDKRRVPDEVVDAVGEIARSQGQVFRVIRDPGAVKRIIRINQETLFDDLKNDAVHAEILHWLRFSRREAAARGDGLSAETMLMPGPLLRFAMTHRKMWEAPIVGGIIRRVYLNTMRGVTQLGWLEGSFRGPRDYLESGRTFMRIWLEFTVRGVYLHPFGTVITNPRSHAAFVKEAGITETSSSMAWMLFRFGYSKTPPAAHRRTAEEMIVR